MKFSAFLRDTSTRNVQKQLPPSHELQDHEYEQQNLLKLKKHNPSTEKLLNQFNF